MRMFMYVFYITKFICLALCMEIIVSLNNNDDNNNKQKQQQQQKKELIFMVLTGTLILAKNRLSFNQFQLFLYVIFHFYHLFLSSHCHTNPMIVKGNVRKRTIILHQTKGTEKGDEGGKGK